MEGEELVMKRMQKDGGRRKGPRPAIDPGAVKRLFNGSTAAEPSERIFGTLITDIREPEPDITVWDIPLDSVLIAGTCIKLRWHGVGIEVVFSAPLAVVEEHLRPLLLHALAGTLPEKKTTAPDSAFVAAVEGSKS